MAIDPADAHTWYNKALSEESLGRSRDEIASYRKFLELAPPQFAQQIAQARQRLRVLELGTPTLKAVPPSLPRYEVCPGEPQPGDADYEKWHQYCLAERAKRNPPPIIPKKHSPLAIAFAVCCGLAVPVVLIIILILLGS